MAATETLCRRLGLPGVCLRQSTIDLSLALLPDGLARGLLLLPVHALPGGAVLLAAADPLELQGIARQADLAQTLDHPVRLGQGDPVGV